MTGESLRGDQFCNVERAIDFDGMVCTYICIVISFAASLRQYLQHQTKGASQRQRMGYMNMKMRL